jgi:hypothetical protein
VRGRGLIKEDGQRFRVRRSSMTSPEIDALELDRVVAHSQVESW